MPCSNTQTQKSVDFAAGKVAHECHGGILSEEGAEWSLVPMDLWRFRNVLRSMDKKQNPTPKRACIIYMQPSTDDVDVTRLFPFAEHDHIQEVHLL